MDVDATSTGRSGTREEFLRRMRGRCFGCGNSNHNKRDCNCARNSTCNYCKRKGHLEQVCQDKFMGLSRDRGLSVNRQWVAATNHYTEENFSLFNDNPNTTIAATSPPALSSPSGSSEGQLSAQLAHLTSLLSGLSAVVNKPQDF